MNDKELMEDILLTVKGACDLYLHDTIEASTANVHCTFDKVLQDTLCAQDEIYQKMAQKGWYPAECADQNQINKVMQQYSAQ